MMQPRPIHPRRDEIEQVVRLFAPDFGLQPPAMQKLTLKRAERAWTQIAQPLLTAIEALDRERERLLRRIERQARKARLERMRNETEMILRQRREPTRLSS